VLPLPKGYLVFFRSHGGCRSKRVGGTAIGIAFADSLALSALIECRLGAHSRESLISEIRLH
jgi:hypothetical protein